MDNCLVSECPHRATFANEGETAKFCKYHKQERMIRVITLCGGMTLKKRFCKRNAKYEHHTNFYCKTHLNKVSTNDQSNSSRNSNSGQSRSRGNTNSSRNNNSGQSNAQSNMPSMNNLTSEERQIMDAIRKYLTLRVSRDISQADLKKQGKQLLRKIHPDKSRFANLNATELSQKIISHMNNPQRSIFFDWFNSTRRR